MKLPYNVEDKYSIIDYAKRLVGKTLTESCDEDVANHGYGGKGNFGQILEKFYFLYEPNSDSEPDFPIAGLELKSSPLKLLQNKEYRSKERLVLNIINYEKVAAQEFETSSFWKKNACLLLVFYLHNADDNFLDYVIKIVDEWSFPNTDLAIIRKDWETIKQKITDGKAHELSEGDTFYLGACTKGSKGGNLRQQPNSDIQAKQRAYSLKQGYVNHIIASIADSTTGIYGKLISDETAAKKQTIEEIVVEKFEHYYGKTVDEIVNSLGIKINKSAKSFKANLTKAIFGIELSKDIEEFEKAEIIVKTVTLNKSNFPCESMSFPAFEYKKLVKERWEESNFREIFEHKFLFVFFQIENNQFVLRKVKFWNMPYQDRKKIKEVWAKTKEIVTKGNIVKYVDENGKRHTNFPGKQFNNVAHTRPHAQNKLDTYPLPTIDKVTNQKVYTKHGFWLNDTYINDEIYLKE
jgi:DNA mismatch repair protein MutH